METLQAQGKAVVFVLVDGKLKGAIALADVVRPEAKQTVDALKALMGYNVVAIPLVAGALYAWGVLLTPALGAVLMSASTVIVAINARLLRLKKSPSAEERDSESSDEPKPRDNGNSKTVITTTNRVA